ncbi:MAG: right-handed parallel beta-helix repeat-containing protein [Planctomyces sp.]|nr:right-handed parallel beta-helix repeat-containing protein [Planctomyces sp.]
MGTLITCAAMVLLGSAAQPACPVTGLPACPCNSDPLVTVVRDGQVQTIDKPVRLRTLVVQKGGKLILRPGAEIIIADLPIDTNMDPEQFGHGILVHGSFHATGTAKTPWLRATAGIPKGATACTLDQAPQGWKVGDLLALPDTRQKVHTKKVAADSQSEVVKLTKINGRVIEFTAAQFAHAAGPRTHLTPHVANLTRDIVIRSENPAGVRGHMMCMQGAYLEVQNVEFRDMGRTDKARQIDSAVGSTPGTNQLGRYPLHLHLMGPTDALIRGNSVVRSPGWAIAVHGTQGPRVTDNVAYDIRGSAFVCEDGSETATFERNIAIKCRNGWHTGVFRKGSPKQVHEFGGDGSGFWFRGMGASVKNNVAADCEFAGYNWQGYYNVVKAPYVKPGTFESNEAYAGRMHSWATWPQGTINVIKNYQPTEFRNFTGWHFWESGMESYHSGRHRFVGWRLYNDPKISDQNSGGGSMARTNIGFRCGNSSYENVGYHFEDCVVQGFNVGLHLPTRVAEGELLTVRKLWLSNYVNIVAHTTLVSRPARFSDITFIPAGMVKPRGSTVFPVRETDIWMYQIPGSKAAPLVTGRSELVFEDTQEVIFFPDDPNAPANASTHPRVVGKIGSASTYGGAIAGTAR